MKGITIALQTSIKFCSCCLLVGIVRMVRAKKVACTESEVWHSFWTHLHALSDPRYFTGALTDLAASLLVKIRERRRCDVTKVLHKRFAGQNPENLFPT